MPEAASMASSSRSRRTGNGRIVICVPRRSAFGRRNGALKEAHPAWLLGKVWNSMFEAEGIRPSDIDDVVVGCVQQIGEQAYNVARTSWLWAGLPVNVPAVTVERQCTSSHQAVIFAGAMVSSGLSRVVAVGGVESLTRIPMRAPYVNGPGERYPALFRDRFPIPTQGESAEMIARRWGITREAADRFGLRSQTLAADATAADLLKEQIVPIEVDGSIVDRDEGIRPTTLEGLARLKPAFSEDGIHTAGTSSQITDGASAAIVTDERTADEKGLEPVLTLDASVVVADDPILMLTGIIPATQKLLQQAGLGVDDVAAFEVNEAFAAVVLAWQKELDVPDRRVNRLGGAIAYGHPLGATGVRLFGSLSATLRPGERGVVTICGGGGVATASLVTRLRG